MAPISVRTRRENRGHPAFSRIDEERRSKAGSSRVLVRFRGFPVRVSPDFATKLNKVEHERDTERRVVTRIASGAYGFKRSRRRNLDSSAIDTGGNNKRLSVFRAIFRVLSKKRKMRTQGVSVA